MIENKLWLVQLIKKNNKDQKKSLKLKEIKQIKDLKILKGIFYYIIKQRTLKIIRGVK